MQIGSNFYCPFFVSLFLMTFMPSYFLILTACIPGREYQYPLPLFGLHNLYYRKQALSKHEFSDEPAITALERFIIIRASMDDKE